MAVQFGLVEALDTGLADGLGATVLHRIKRLGFFFIDSADVANRMGEMRAQRVMAHELRLDVDTGQAELVNRQ